MLGYDERGRVIKAYSPDVLDGALREAVALTYPLIPASLEAADNVQDGPSHMIVVPASKQRHGLASQRGNAVEVMPEAFEDRVMPGATLDDFDPEIIAEFAARREQRTRRPVPADTAVLLREVGALTASGEPTVAGVLLFGKNPGIFIKSAGVVFVKFPGIDMRADGGAMGYGRREEISGPLARVVERTWAVVFEEMRVGAVVKGKEREDVLEYPELTVREALVNAICHRDYGLHGRRIEIRKFSDRLEIHSPGGLAGHVTLDNILEEHFSRNPTLVRGLFQWGYIEELGLGVDRMMEEMERAGHPRPTLEDKRHSFVVTLSNYHDTRRSQVQITPAASLAPNTVLPSGVTINERQARALKFINDHGRITNGDFQKLCPDVSSETLRADLSDLSSKGLVMKVGEKKGTYYIAK